MAPVGLTNSQTYMITSESNRKMIDAAVMVVKR
jgi:hypothetical protein